MRYLLMLGVCVSTMVLNIQAQNNSLSGLVQYDNVALTPMHDSTTVYLMQGNTIVMETTTDNQGAYLFQDIPAGTYLLKAFSTKKIGGLNATVALSAVRHFVNIPPLLTGLRFRAADAMGNGTVGTPDALAIARRSIGMIPNFMPPNVPAPGSPDWVSENFTLTIQADSTYTQNIKVLCTGDANGSYVPY